MLVSKDVDQLALKLANMVFVSSCSCSNSDMSRALLDTVTVL
jgi:hypothetical protein